MNIAPRTIISVALLGLQRRSDGVFAWISSDADDDGVDVSCIPLALVPATLLPQRDALLADWNSLRAARQLEAVWPAFWRVFWSTLSQTQDQAALAMPRNSRCQPSC